MADIYRDSISSRQTKRSARKRNVSLWGVLADMLCLVVMVLLMAATLICCINPYISPEKMGILSVVVLAAPVIYLLDIAMLLYWLVRWRWRAAIVALATLVVATIPLGKYYQIDLKRSYEQPYNERQLVKVMSYNVANGTAPGIVEYIKEKNPSILCLQEFLFDYSKNWELLGDKYSTTADGAYDFSCEIMSRYPILRHGVIDSIRRFNGVWADVMIKSDTVRVINLHLQSTSIRQPDTQFIEEHGYLRDSNRSSRLQSIVSRLAENNAKRAVQARHVRRFIDESPVRHIIVCGDFNDVPLSYTYRHIAKDFTNAFSEAGSGYTYTFDGFFRLLSIDYMLSTDEMEIVSYEADHAAKYSDHYPLITRFKIKQDDENKR